jgi:uncharacterized membrane protein YeaQ/YmgE (transglycosylase-associated protein family)
MDMFYWIMIGALVAFGAKVQIPTDKEENMLALLAMGILGAVVAGFAVHAAVHTGILSTGWAGHVAAFTGAALLVLASRAATQKHLA